MVQSHPSGGHSVPLRKRSARLRAFLFTASRCDNAGSLVAGAPRSTNPALRVARERLGSARTSLGLTLLIPEG